jgi:REP element-mobilizing transposase RayT
MARQEFKENMSNVNSGCHKKLAQDTRNNWVTMMFKTKCNYNCFQKQSHIDTCTQAFRDFERLGFEFRDFGFGGSHVHFPVNVPKKYSIQTAETMLKSYSAKKMFEAHPGFRKRYPRGGFWSGYEHHESTGLIDLEKSIAYCQSQQQRHGVIVVDDRQQRLPTMTAE